MKQSQSGTKTKDLLGQILQRLDRFLGEPMDMADVKLNYEEQIEALREQVRVLEHSKRVNLSQSSLLVQSSDERN